MWLFRRSAATTKRRTSHRNGRSTRGSGRRPSSSSTVQSLTDVGFVHRDFHPGNLLWRRNELIGVVDWQAACRGPASIDPAQCRMDMLLYDANLADELRGAWEQASRQTFHPWADIMCIIGTLDSLRDEPPTPAARDAIENTLTHAVKDLGH